MQAVKRTLESSWVTQGAEVAAFEVAFAKRHGVSDAVAVSSGTAGLHLALAALGIGPGEEVIVPAFTWVSCANAIVYCGATPVFADVDAETFNIAVADVERKLTPRTRAVMAVHLFGLPADIDYLDALLPNGVHIVEDAACAAGAEIAGQPVGGLGDVGVFSFHPRKVITTGEGGMVTTNDAALADRVRVLRNHGAGVSEEDRHAGPKPHQLPGFDVLGFNYRMTDLQGAVGRVQLEKLDRLIDERARWADYYRERLGDLDWLRLPEQPKDGRHGWQAFVAYVDPLTSPMSRNDLMERLQSQGIATRPGTHAIPELGLYRERFAAKPEDFPVAKACAENTLALPLHNRMTSEDYAYVVNAIRGL